MNKKVEFPGVDFGETLTEKKREICINSLMKYMREKYNTADAVVSYVLDRVNSVVSRRRMPISQLAKICSVQDFCEAGESSKGYLTAVLHGKKNMQYPLLDRLAMSLNLKGDRIFPFKEKGSKPSTVAEYVLFPVEKS